MGNHRKALILKAKVYKRFIKYRVVVPIADITFTRTRYRILVLCWTDLVPSVSRRAWPVDSVGCKSGAHIRLSDEVRGSLITGGWAPGAGNSRPAPSPPAHHTWFL